MVSSLRYTTIFMMHLFVWKFWTFLYFQKFVIQTGISVVSAEIFTETFDVTKINGISYGKALITFNVRSKLECFKDCSQWDKCLSLVYNPVTRVCEANELTAGVATTTCVGNTCYFYASKKSAESLTTTTTTTTITTTTTPPTTTATAATVIPTSSATLTNAGTTVTSQATTSSSSCASTMRMSCSTSSTCTDTLSECRDSICKCERGYAFLAATCSCVEECTSYGPTFQAELNAYTVTTVQQRLTDINSDDDCYDLCFRCTEFLCKAYDYSPVTRRCYIHATTNLQTDQLDEYGQSPSYTYTLHTRDCFN